MDDPNVIVLMNVSRNTTPKQRPSDTTKTRQFLTIWKRDIKVADIEELGEMDASEIHAKRLNAKEVSTPMSGENFNLPIEDGTVKLSGGDQRLRTSTLIRDRPDRREE